MPQKSNALIQRDDRGDRLAQAGRTKPLYSNETESTRSVFSRVPERPQERLVRSG